MRWLLCLLFACWCSVLPAQAQQETDRGYLAELLEEQLGGPGRTVRIEGFSGAFSSRATISRITVADEKGIWLEIDGAAIEWNRSALLQGAIDIEQMSAARILVARAPEPVDTGLPDAEASGFSLPELPVSIQIGALSVQELSLGAPLIGEAVTLSFQGAASLANGDGTVAFDLRRSDGKIGQFKGNATYATTSENLDINLSLIEGQSGILARLAGLPRDPSISATIEGAGPLANFAADIALATEGQDRLTGRFVTSQAADSAERGFDLDVRGDVAPLFLPEYRAFFGDDIALDITGARDEDGAITLRRLALETDALDLRGAVTLTPAFWPTFVDIEGQIASRDGSAVLLPISGAATRIDRADVLLKYDTRSADQWSGFARVDGLTRDEVAIPSLRLTARGTLDPVADETRIGRLDGDVSFAAQDMAFADANLQRAIGDSVSGEFTLALQSGAPVRFSQISLGGADYQLQGAAQVQGIDQALRTDFDLDLVAEQLSRFAGLIGQPLRGRADLTLAGFADLGGAFSVEVSGQTNRLWIGQAQADRILAGVTQLETQVVRSQEGLRVNALEINNPQLDLTGDAFLTGAQSNASFDLRLANAALVAPGANGPVTVAGTAMAQGDVWQIDVEGGGPFGVSAAVQGVVTGAQPRLNFDARLPDIGRLVDGFSGPATLSGTASEGTNGWQIESAITGPAAANATLSGVVAPTGRANLSVRGGLPLGLLNPFLSPQRIQGQAGFDLQVNGPLDLSSVSGRVGLSDVRVSAPTARIALEGGVGQIDLAGENATISFQAQANTGGRVTADGSLGLSGNLPADITITLDRLAVIDPALYRTAVTGRLQITGPARTAPQISGLVTLDETRIKVPSTGLGGFSIVPEIAHVGASNAVTATQRKAGIGQTAQEGASGSAASTAFRIGLDVTVEAPNRIFVRGRGLDAELGGRIQIGGTTDAIVSSGRFELIRGRLDLLTKRFALDEGSIQLSGDLDPFIRFVATTQTDTGTASVVVTGRASAPEVTFEATPDAPEDEVLAQIFFGRDAAQLSAFQALELANAVRQLQGKGGEGVVAKLRRGFDLDDLDIRVDDEGNAAVRAGKYISENVYTDVEVGQTTEVTINVDITSNLTARGKVTSEGNTSLGIFFEKDY
ncbi:translocation/assembly module TamB domain-containing protein [Nereida sp. MMG025]|uniref:translocation/assembly module TamB domain-containing protein n=1 Tax=Nereida sp. MMG025 TaxID=2909981 RepID=UPI001F023FA4|nr:translocation/assembly module TamB domain-containing protein [Nereida sp. MMG025]MCF6444941.1 translocation/assembly module TamB domain-containing protein [Nereida sp. MMG025]